MWLVRRKIGWEHKIKQNRSREGGGEKDSTWEIHYSSHPCTTHTTRRENSATCNRDVNQKWPWVDSSEKRKYKKIVWKNAQLRSWEYLCALNLCGDIISYLSYGQKFKIMTSYSVGANIGEVQPLRRSTWRDTLKWQTRLPFDLEILLLEI